MSERVLFAGDATWIAPAVYGLVDPREPSRVRYVGSSVAPGSRYASHLYVPPRPRLTVREQWVADLRRDGQFPVMVLLEQVEAVCDLTPREQHWISSLRAVGQADINVATKATGPGRGTVRPVVRETLQVQVAKRGNV